VKTGGTVEPTFLPSNHSFPPDELGLATGILVSLPLWSPTQCRLLPRPANSLGCALERKIDAPEGMTVDTGPLHTGMILDSTPRAAA
jgi:hypothetical protein